MPVRLVVSICHPLLLVSCNDPRGIDYATTLTQALLQVLASYSMQRFFQLPRLNSHSHPNPVPWLILLPFPWESHGTHGIPVFPIPMHTSSANNIRRRDPTTSRRERKRSGAERAENRVSGSEAAQNMAEQESGAWSGRSQSGSGAVSGGYRNRYERSVSVHFAKHWGV